MKLDQAVYSIPFVLLGTAMLLGGLAYGHKYSECYGYDSGMIPIWFVLAGVGGLGVCVIISYFIIKEEVQK